MELRSSVIYTAEYSDSDIITITFHTGVVQKYHGTKEDYSNLIGNNPPESYLKELKEASTKIEPPVDMPKKEKLNDRPDRD